MAFKLQDEGIAIDNDDDLDSKTFEPAGVEKAIKCPATTEFLSKRLDEYQTLSQNIDTASCYKLTPVYIEYRNGKIVDLISFQTIGGRSSADSLPRIVNKLSALRQKYTYTPKL